jgi:hypothetical protein
MQILGPRFPTRRADQHISVALATRAASLKAPGVPSATSRIERLRMKMPSFGEVIHDLPATPALQCLSTWRDSIRPSPWTTIRRAFLYQPTDTTYQCRSKQTPARNGRPIDVRAFSALCVRRAFSLKLIAHHHKGICCNPHHFRNYRVGIEAVAQRPAKTHLNRLIIPY